MGPVFWHVVHITWNTLKAGRTGTPSALRTAPNKRNQPKKDRLQHQRSALVHLHLLNLLPIDEDPALSLGFASGI